MHAVEPQQTLHLFPTAPLQLVLRAEAAGNSPVRAWGDQPTEPSCALLWDGGACLYLGGEAPSPAFAQAAAEKIAGLILPALRQRGTPGCKLLPASQAWADQIERLLPGLKAHRLARYFYRWEGPPPSRWRERLPEGWAVQQIDAALLERRDLLHLERLRGEIESVWPSLEAFLSGGFGFCLVEGSTLAGWCTGEYFSPGWCGIGIETVEEYQRRGVAVFTASAFLEHCQAQGQTAHWDCWAWNEPSVKTAERLGFQRLCEYAAYLFRLE